MGSTFLPLEKALRAYGETADWVSTLPEAVVRANPSSLPQKIVDISGILSIKRFEYGVADNWGEKALKFLGNSGISVINGLTGAADALVNLHVTGTKIVNGIDEAVDYIHYTSGKHIWDDTKSFLKETLTDPRTYEDLAGMALTWGVNSYAKIAGSKISGRIQTWGTKTPFHQQRQLFEAWKAALDPRVERVTMSRNWNSLAEINAPRKGNWMPDVGIKYKNGTFKTIEIQSKYDNPQWLLDKHINFMETHGLGGTSKVFKPLGIFDKPINKLINSIKKP
jgi:hypothetical protein